MLVRLFAQNKSFFVLTVFWLLNSALLTSCGVVQGHKSDDTPLKTVLARKTSCNLFGKQKVKYNNVEFIRSAAYGHAYFITPDFEYVKQKKFNDTTSYLSRDKKCTIKIWPGQTVSFPLGSVDTNGKFIELKLDDIVRVENAVDEYIEKLKKGEDSELGVLRKIEVCKATNGYKFEINVKGADEQFGYFYKICVLELPVSGDLVFNHFMFKYELKSKTKYSPVGLAMANYFGNLLDKIQ